MFPSSGFCMQSHMAQEKSLVSLLRTLLSPFCLPIHFHPFSLVIFCLLPSFSFCCVHHLLDTKITAFYFLPFLILFTVCRPFPLRLSLFLLSFSPARLFVCLSPIAYAPYDDRFALTKEAAFLLSDHEESDMWHSILVPQVTSQHNTVMGVHATGKSAPFLSRSSTP